MCGLTVLNKGQASMESVNQANRRMKKLQESGGPRMFSSNPMNSCKVFCCFCDKVVSLSGLGKHVNNTHRVMLKEYKALFGNPRNQIIKLVFHKCEICKKVLLLNTDDMSKHMKKAHQLAYKDYMIRYMTNSDDCQQEILQQPNQKKPASMLERKAGELVKIQCGFCRKTFKQNIQLKVHMRKHSP